MERVVHPEHWALWAVEERCPGEGLQIGYPTQSPQHTVARRAKEQDPDHVPKAPITAHDQRIARLIAVAVRMMIGGDRADDRRLLRTYHGAHPGATASREERMAECCVITGKAVSATRHQIRQAEQYVEGWVEGATRYAQIA